MFAANIYLFKKKLPMKLNAYVQLQIRMTDDPYKHFLLSHTTLQFIQVNSFNEII